MDAGKVISTHRQFTRAGADLLRKPGFCSAGQSDQGNAE
jgi:hypothetical protein